jgi:hypothetical protein
VVANATSAVAVTPANIASAWAYRTELRANLRRFAALGVVSLFGGLLGAHILTRTDNASFRELVPWLLLFATLLFAASPRIVALARALGKREGGHPSTAAWLGGLVIQCAVAIYGGFFGAGMGIVMLAAMAITEGDDFPPHQRGQAPVLDHHSARRRRALHRRRARQLARDGDRRRSLGDRRLSRRGLRRKLPAPVIRCS